MAAGRHLGFLDLI